jgi:hypothetical protein
MAISKYPFLSGISGKVGPIVAYVLHNKQFVRKHTIPRDPKTPAQLAQRAKVSLVNKGLSPFNKLIKENYGNDSSAYRSLVGKTMRECVVGEYPDFAIDFSQVLLAEGEVLLPENVTAEFRPDTGQLTLHWDPLMPPREQWCKPDDLFNVILFHTPTKTLNRSHFIAKRADGTATVELSNGSNPSNTVCWIYLTSHNHAQNSNSLYVNL